jgi:hypothetical protein
MLTELPLDMGQVEFEHLRGVGRSLSTSDLVALALGPTD